MTDAFGKSIDRFAEQQGVDVVRFERHPRKDELTQGYLARFRGTEGVLYIGTAQEKARVMRTEWSGAIPRKSNIPVNQEI